jgi:hypothetical protein
MSLIFKPKTNIMKKVALLLLLVFSTIAFSVSASVSPSIENPLAKENAYRMKIEMLKKIASMDIKSFEQMTGKHMNFIQRNLFKLEQKKLRKSFDENGNITNKKLDKYLQKSSGDGSSGFHLGGFALGFLLGLIGVLIAYVAFKDDNKQNRIKWAWIGTAVVVLLNLIIIVAVL